MRMTGPVYHAIGLMSGSSLDGLDIAYVKFEKNAASWDFEIVHADCLQYPPTLLHQLKTATQLPAKELFLVHTQLGHLFGNAVRNFMLAHQIETVDFIASHGHTIFHEPAKMMTCQIGDGAAIAISSGIRTVSDVRSSDIAAGGQGAPIVPMGDRLLFPAFDAWLNIGGIANISLRDSLHDGVVAYDIVAANQVLNYYANRLGKEFDEDGKIARSGEIHVALASALNDLDYYTVQAPKSLDNGFCSGVVIPLIETFAISDIDKLATYTHHIALQIAKQISDGMKVLATGGGALNTYLLSLIQQNSTATITSPSLQTVQYKEALIMAFLGLLRLLEQENVLSSVTGARKNTVNGAVYLP